MYLQLNTQFNPFTYKEMVEPLAYYKQAYDEVLQAYDAITDDAEALLTIVNEEDSPIAYGTYNRYMYELNNALNSFGEGLTPGTRKRLSRLRGRFSSDIKPIANAYLRKLALQDEQRKAEAANPTMLWLRKASDMSLDDIIANPTIDYGGSYSGAAITLLVANMAVKLSKEALEGKLGKTILKLLLPYQYEALSRTGFSSDAILQAIINSPDAPEILTNMVESTIDSTGIRNWNNPEALQRAYDYARQGLYNAIGETTRNVITDQAGLAAYKAQLDGMNAQRAFNRQLEAAGLKDGKKVTPFSFINADPKVSKYAASLASLTDKNGRFFSKYFGRNTTKDPFINPIEFRNDFLKYVQEHISDANMQNIPNYMSVHGFSAVPYRYNTDAVATIPIGLELKLYALGDVSYDRMSQEAKNIYQLYLKDNNLPLYLRIVNKDLYAALEAIGYDKKGGAPINDGSMLNYEIAFKPSIDKLGKMKTYWSTSMSGYDYPNKVIKGTLGLWNLAGNFNLKVYEVKGNGDVGKSVDYGDLKLTGDNANSITDICYYPYQPDYLMVLIGDKHYYIQPEALGETVANIIRAASSQIKPMLSEATPELLTLAGKSVTSSLVNLFNNYNQTSSKTSSSAVE